MQRCSAIVSCTVSTPRHPVRSPSLEDSAWVGATMGEHPALANGVGKGDFPGAQFGHGSRASSDHRLFKSVAGNKTPTLPPPVLPPAFPEHHPLDPWEEAKVGELQLQRHLERHADDRSRESILSHHRRPSTPLLSPYRCYQISRPARQIGFVKNTSSSAVRQVCSFNSFPFSNPLSLWTSDIELDQSGPWMHSISSRSAPSL